MAEPDKKCTEKKKDSKETGCQAPQDYIDILTEKLNHNLELAGESMVKRKLYVVSRGAKLANKGSTNYQTDYSENSFRVDNYIHLEALGFYGPFKATKEKYGVAIRIMSSKFEVGRNPYFNQREIYRKKTDGRCIVAKEKGIFFIGTDSLILEPHTWYHIKFILGGPETATLDAKSIDNTTKEIKIDIGNGRTDRVGFQFLRGVKQMPQLVFSAIPPEDVPRAQSEIVAKKAAKAKAKGYSHSKQVIKTKEPCPCSIL